MRPFTNPRLTEPAVWRRQEAGSRNTYGEFVPGATADKDIRVTTAPGGAPREPTPAGQRVSDLRTFWVDKSTIRGAADATTEAAALDPATPREADIIVYGGSDWRINDALDWGDFLELRTLRSDE